MIQYSNRLRTLGLTAAENRHTSNIDRSSNYGIWRNGSHGCGSHRTDNPGNFIGDCVTARFSQYCATRAGVLQRHRRCSWSESANIDGLRTAVENAGGSIKDALIPVMEELAVRFAAPPPESYAASIDELQNSFFLLQAEIGSTTAPGRGRVCPGVIHTV